MKKLITKIIAALPVQQADRGTYQPNYNPTEYPLFTQDAADHCPTARYVGGVSRWLCECSDPKICHGVYKARLLAAGIKYTRKDYMDGLKEMDGKARHDLYYAQFVTPAVVNRVLSDVSIKQIMQSEDPHFNDIPLRIWDHLGLPQEVALWVGMANNFTYAKPSKPGLSQADQVCVNKQVARIIKNTLSVSIVGSPNFYDTDAAIAYYKIYGYLKNDVMQKIDSGEITIGRPVLSDPDSQWFSLDADKRYQIHIIE